MAIQWTDGTPIASPVFLDSSVIVAFLVSGHPNYVPAAKVIAEVTSARTPIVLSELVIAESVWALTKIAFRDLRHLPANHPLDPARWRRDFRDTFAKQGAKVALFSDWFNVLAAAGYPIAVVAQSHNQWLATPALLAKYMNAFGLQGYDAAHLSIAARHAKSFVSADKAYHAVGGAEAPAGLSVLVLVPPPTAAVAPSPAATSRPSKPKKKQKLPVGRRPGAHR